MPLTLMLTEAMPTQLHVGDIALDFSDRMGDLHHTFIPESLNTCIVFLTHVPVSLLDKKLLKILCVL